MGVDNLAMPMKVPPFVHQRRAYEMAIKTFSNGQSDGYALLMEMGTGKSLTAIGIAGAMYLSGKVRRVLVVAPLSILGVWEEEFSKYAGFDYSLAILSGSGTKKAEVLRRMTGAGLQVAVVNYESAWRLEQEIVAWRPDLVIADEGHKIKTHNAAVSKAMHRIGARAAYRLLLTGTVITNKALDVFSQYKYLKLKKNWRNSARRSLSSLAM